MQKNYIFSVLSIGSGEGDIDLEIIHSLKSKLNPRWKQLRYVALEPNPIHRDRFLQRLDKISFDENVEISVHDEYFEPDRFEREQKYDLVLLTHVLYYFEEPYQAIRSALNQTKKGGKVVIVHQTATGIPQIQREYMLEVKGDQNEMFTAEDIRNLLDTKSHQHQFHHVDARLDVRDFRLLDVACGTGRWLEAVRHYIQLDKGLENIVYDFLDPCGSSISQASKKIHLRFQRGTQYVNTIQAAKLESNSYDLLWSMHGFYLIPRQDLKPVLKKCASLLNDTGVGFIALATRKSFYVDFYEQYLQIFQEGKGAGFTSAEDIVESLCTCGIKHQVNRIFYEEPIKVDDRAGLEHYIKNEATINSFNKDKEVEALSASKNITLEDLLSHPKMEQYLKSLIRNSVYYFPQEIFLISFYR